MMAYSSRGDGRVTGFVSVDLSDHVDFLGFATHVARQRLWRACATVPAGADLEVRLGGIRYVDSDLMFQLAEYGQHIGEIIFVGPDGRVVGQHITALRRALIFRRGSGDAA